jgi:hypothetical protein
MLGELDMHVRSMDFQDTDAIVPKWHVFLQDRIYQVYTIYILDIYHEMVTCKPA